MSIKDLTKPSLEMHWAQKIATQQTKDNVNKSASPQVNKSVSLQVDKETNQQVDKSTSPQINKLLNQQVNNTNKRYTTYLRPENIKTIKQIAIIEDKNDFDVVQEAVDSYFKKKGYE